MIIYCHRYNIYILCFFLLLSLGTFAFENNARDTGAMNKTIVKINKTITILNNFSNCCQFCFAVLLKNGKLGPRA